jgi:pyruvate dehydrogenase E2 component (dihydrolipoamide acetyltransferase)
MEALSPTMEEGQLVRWLKNEGDEVAEGDVLAEIETDKATMELVARGAGTLRNIRLQEGDTAPVGTVIAVIGGDDDESADDDASADTDADSDEDESDEAPSRDRRRSKQPARAAADDDDDEEAERDERPPRKAARAAKDDEDEDAEEPDESEVPGGGAREGSAKAVGIPEEKGASASTRGAGEDGERDGARRERGGGDGRVKASPLARRLAAEAGVELDDIDGTGPGGRITKRDIEAAMKAQPVAAPPAATPLERYEGPDVEDVPVTQMRKAIAKRLAQSIGPIPTFYLTIEVDMTRITEARERVNARLEKHGVKASVNDFIIKAAAAALARHPEVNASWGESVIHRHRRVHIGIAVAIDDGLITPIVRDADRKGIAQIAQEVRELAGRAREKKLKPDDYTGATFSVSNLGMFGIEEFTAIINPPEAAILAIGQVEEKVVVEDGDAVIAPRMRITMSCDHRVIDGAMGARFLQTLKDYLEEPMMILA